MNPSIHIELRKFFSEILRGITRCCRVRSRGKAIGLPRRLMKINWEEEYSSGKISVWPVRYLRHLSAHGWRKETPRIAKFVICDGLIGPLVLVTLPMTHSNPLLSLKNNLLICLYLNLYISLILYLLNLFYA